MSLLFRKQHDLFPRKQKDRLTVLYWQEVQNYQEYNRYKSLSPNPKNTVKTMEYYREQNKLISCSNDPAKSVVINHMGSKNHSYVFKMSRGTNCFAYSSSLSVLITGSEDGLVRIWNPVVVQKPVLATSSHRHGIVDIAILSVIGLFVTMSRDAELRLWEIKEFKCVQVITLKLPCFNDGRSVEWGIKCLFPGPKRQNEEKTNRHLTGDKWFLEDDNIEVARSKNSSQMNVHKDCWERSNILVICCNTLCKINLNFYDDKNRNFHVPVLPMQPLLNSVLIPNDWVLNDVEESGKREIGAIGNEIEVNEEFERRIQNHMEELKFVLDRDFTGFISKNHDMNVKLVQLEEQKQKMQFYVENGAPFLALDLYEPEELEIPDSLPVPNVSKIGKLVAQTRSSLSNAKARSVIFSDRSSSTKSPRSSRSSCMEFN